MISKTDNYGDFSILRIKRDFDKIEDILELEEDIDALIGGGRKKIAISFSDTRRLYGKIVAPLIYASNRLKKMNGFLCIFGANEEIRDRFDTIGLELVIKVYQDEAEFCRAQGI